MDDLISREALLEEIEDWHDSLGGTMNPADWGIQNVLQSVMDYIIEAETVNAVPVVRCRECRHADRSTGCEGLNCVWCNRRQTCEQMDGFCYMGAKMDAKEE